MTFDLAKEVAQANAAYFGAGQSAEVPLSPDEIPASLLTVTAIYNMNICRMYYGHQWRKFFNTEWRNWPVMRDHD